MQLALQSRASILRRIAQLETELRRARDELKGLRPNDPATSEVVIRGAQLSHERTHLESRLEAIRLVSNNTMNLTSQQKGLQ